MGTPSCAPLLRLQVGVARDPGTGGAVSTLLGGAPFLRAKAGHGPRGGAVAHPYVPGEPALKRPPFWFAWANGDCAGTGMGFPAFMIRNLEVCDIPEPALQHNAHTLGNTYDTAYYALAYSTPHLSYQRRAMRHKFLNRHHQSPHEIRHPRRHSDTFHTRYSPYRQTCLLQATPQFRTSRRLS